METEQLSLWDSLWRLSKEVKTKSPVNFIVELFVSGDGDASFTLFVRSPKKFSKRLKKISLKKTLTDCESS